MTDYFVASGGDNSDGLTWAKAYTSLQTALTAASTNGDRIIIQYNGVPSGDAELSADTTYTFAANVSLISSTNSGTGTITPTLMGTANWIGNSTTNRSVSFTGGYKVFVYGITIRVGGSSSDNIVLGSTGTKNDFIMDQCYLWLNSSTASVIRFGVVSAAGQSNSAEFHHCTFRFGASGQSITTLARTIINGGNISSDGTAPTSLFSTTNARALIRLNAVDLSFVTGTLVSDQTTGYNEFVFINCKLGSGVTVMAAQTTTPSNGSCDVWVYNCASGDTHYHIQHHNAFGSTTVDTGIYANDGAQYDGTNRCSWKLVTTANCSIYHPYKTPWIDCYHSGTSAITPSLEIVRSGSATAYQDDEVWGEFSYQGTSGSPLAIIVMDRMALAGTAANQTTGALDASGWTGENATSWFGKLNPTTTITPAEIGHLRARVCVGEPEITVYVDPQIRGRS